VVVEPNKVFLIKKQGYMVTPKRIEIVRTLLEEGASHPSLKSLHAYCELFTLYFTILKLGLVRLFQHRR